MKLNIFVLLSTCMKVSVSLLCLFVCEPQYQTVVVCCNPIFLAAVLRAWATVPVSMLKWGLLRLTLITHLNIKYHIF